jgi:hypothetical protein
MTDSEDGNLHPPAGLLNPVALKDLIKVPTLRHKWTCAIGQALGAFKLGVLAKFESVLMYTDVRSLCAHHTT